MLSETGMNARAANFFTRNLKASSCLYSGINPTLTINPERLVVTLHRHVRRSRSSRTGGFFM